ncbi:DUF4260 domain-containing protein [Curtobacterium sp. ISL-83]|uniref:DUF4260 domain-containing protein n=1 Tax=Curtobacterium sp. ISL-83 TaxID=2819145 RepID=UPI001BEACA9E|nr:DUF4260 domain-containing protein [Curtobacterium sp. ISL-83]MBT2504260.1 DUF4260 domain-containing protein [Curtobacterium sp. ISL-83]
MTNTLPDAPSASSLINGPDSAPARTDATLVCAPAPGVVTGRPRAWLRAEGAAIAAAAIVAYATTGAPWWLIPALFLAPDLSMLAYLINNRVGAWTYNLAHTAPLPVVLLAAGFALNTPVLVVAGAIGLVHIGLDRLMGYGVKYDHGFGHTHLGIKQPAAPADTQR